MAASGGRGLFPLLAFVAGFSLLASGTAPGANVNLVNNDGAGEGFNDPTPVAPVGGNPGTTIGAQRLNVFQAAAAAWGARLNSRVTIVVSAQFNPLTCSASSAVLGSAGPTTAHANFTGAPFASTYYIQALANKLAGSDLSVVNADISAQFNSQIGTTGCLETSGWYYGLDHLAPANRIDLFGVVEHEIGHGLGFVSLVNTTTGAKFNGLDDAYMRNLEDHSLGQSWPALTDGQRLASMIDNGDLHWTGAAATAQTGAFSSGVASGHLRMYAPSSFAPGSSVSHWDTALFPNELMEPNYVAGSAILATDELLTDIGWGALNMDAVVASRMFTLPPCRVVDTRDPDGPLGGPALPASGGADRAFPLVSGACGIPANAIALSVNVTVVNPAASGDVLVYPGDRTAPDVASSVAFLAGKTRAAVTVVRLPNDGTATVKARNRSGGPVDLLIDVTGYFRVVP